MSGLWIALGFLSRVPAPHVEFTPSNLARALFWFPFVGVLLGCIWWSAAAVGSGLGAGMLAFLLTTAGVLFTGALHLDGVADTFDGFSASGGGKERALEAMKDSRIGAHGAVALSLTLLGKFVAFQNLGFEIAGLVAIGAATLARFGCAVVVATVEPARASGLGASFASAHDPSGGKGSLISRPGVRAALLGAVWLATPAFCAGWSASRWAVLGVCSSVAIACAWFMVRRCVSVFGGVTGDTHGALIELSETAFLLAGAACSTRVG